MERCPYYFTEEDIPNNLKRIYYEYDYITPAMLWIRRRRTLPPDTLLHNPEISSLSGNETCAMFWLIHCDGNVPKILRHSPNIKDAYGFTCMMWWIACRGDDVPRYMRHDPAIQDNEGYTCAIKWIGKYRTRPPRYLLYAKIRERINGLSDNDFTEWNEWLIDELLGKSGIERDYTKKCYSLSFKRDAYLDEQLKEQNVVRELEKRQMNARKKQNYERSKRGKGGW